MALIGEASALRPRSQHRSRVWLLVHADVSQDACTSSDDVTKLPGVVRELLVSRIDSFEKLELVVALHAAPRTTMSVEDLCRALKMPRDTVRQAAMDLRAVALIDLTSRGEVQLLPPTSRDQQAIGELFRLYNEDRILLVQALGDIAVQRIRGMASRAFADAFVLRKKPPKDGDDG